MAEARVLAPFLAVPWFRTALAAAVFVGALGVGTFLRWALLVWSARRERRGHGRPDPLAIVLRSLEWALPLWFGLAGAFAALHLLRDLLTPVSLAATDRLIAALFVLSLTWAVAVMTARVVRVCTQGMNVAFSLTQPALLVVQGLVAVAGGLLFLYVIGLPITPVLVLISIVAVGLALALRNILPDLAAGVMMALSQEVRRGDYIQLSSGEEGVVVHIDWRFTVLRTSEGTEVAVPNSRLASATVVRVARGRPAQPPRPVSPFRFYSRVALKEPAGIRASTLQELLEGVRQAPLGALYYHTLLFIQDYDYLIPQPPSEFAYWVGETLQYRDLAELLSSLDPCAMPSLEAYREALVARLEDYLATHREVRVAPAGEEFHFIKASAYVIPSPFEARDLVELVQALRQVSPDSLYYHLFEARTLEGRPSNDLSAWLSGELEEHELAQRIAQLDPYTYTAEGLRQALVRMVEERLGVPVEA